jgi:hypothetical protein
MGSMGAVVLDIHGHLAAASLEVLFAAGLMTPWRSLGQDNVFPQLQAGNLST